MVQEATAALQPDICVVGGGPGGIAAARAAAAEGVSVVLVERSRPGGAMLSATVPTKALLAAAETAESLRSGAAIGVSGAPLQVNLARVRDHLVAVGEASARPLSPERLAAAGVTVLAASARFSDPNTIVAGDTVIRARRIVLAVGSKPSAPPLPGLESVETVTLADLLDLTRRPAHLLIAGAGPYALELAQGLTRLGIDTSIIDQGPALPEEDPELADLVVDRLRAEGIRVRLGITVESVSRRRGGIRVAVTDPVEGERVIDGSHLLLAAGRSPDIADLDLGMAGIAHNAEGIVVDRGLRTTNRRVYAIGDAVAGPALVARAEHQGEAVVRSILTRLPYRDDPARAVRVAFTDPGFAAVGFSEAEARRRHRVVRVLRVPFAGSGRALVGSRADGVVKVITTARGRVLGAGVVGPGAPEAVAPWALAVARRLSAASAAPITPPFPTRASLLQDVADTSALPGLTPRWRRRIIEFLRKLG